MASPTPEHEEELGDTPIQLENSWTFWSEPPINTAKPPTPQEYEDNLKFIYKFDTVQMFWRCFNHIPTAEKLKLKTSLHMMLTGIKPMWEDPKNIKGGYWHLRTQKSETQQIWRDLLLAVIGEQFLSHLAPNDQINGVSLQIKHPDYDVIKIWNSNAEQESQEKFRKRIYTLIPDQVTRDKAYPTYQACESK